MAAKIELVKVQSSNINAIGYDALNEELIVEYTSGVKYKYKKVPKEINQKLTEADSKGRFMNAEVKDKFEFERLVE